MHRRTFLAAGAVVASLFLHSAARGDIIDDKSDFVGEFTVIDFETTATGESFGIEAGDYTWVGAGGYSALGVTFSAADPNEGPWVVDSNPSPQFDAAHAVAGSPPKFLAVEPTFFPLLGGYLQFTFDNSVNAVGVSIINWSDGGPVRMEVYDSLGELIDSVEFTGSVIDGIIPGADFGNPYDVQYGFLGLFSPEVPIAYGLIYEDRTEFDDFHFGVIPEPGTIVLILSGIAYIGARGNRRCSARKASVIGISLLATAQCSASALAGGTVSGNVTGWVDLTDGPICGVIDPPECTNPVLSKVRPRHISVSGSGQLLEGGYHV